jgi:hypothetical protein
MTSDQERAIQELSSLLDEVTLAIGLRESGDLEVTWGSSSTVRIAPSGWISLFGCARHVPSLVGFRERRNAVVGGDDYAPFDRWGSASR